MESGRVPSAAGPSDREAEPRSPGRVGLVSSAIDLTHQDLQNGYDYNALLAASPDAAKPAGTPGAVMQEIAKRARKGSIALVGHEPSLGELAARLIGARVRLEFKKGGICRIDFEALPPKGAGHLRWFLTPRMLRAAGRS